jgi:hypothetical protein
VTSEGVQPASCAVTPSTRRRWWTCASCAISGSILSSKGRQTPALLKDRVNFEVMGANEWRHAPSLEAMGNGTLKLYLDSTSVGPVICSRSEVVAAGAKVSRARRAKAGEAQRESQGQTEREFVDQTVNLADRKRRRIPTGCRRTSPVITSRSATPRTMSASRCRSRWRCRAPGRAASI